MADLAARRRAEVEALLVQAQKARAALERLYQDANRERFDVDAEACRDTLRAALDRAERVERAIAEARYHLTFATPKTRNGPCLKAMSVLDEALARTERED